ncbi:hypothetical protein LCGC14_2713520 [marine sediment metagenome]|uniref:Uncharacterized protein n=1 Tax=marine sediment metagenome TaxID=412755 RepID=A0A0F8ZZX8_9ZZZZ
MKEYEIDLLNGDVLPNNIIKADCYTIEDSIGMFWNNDNLIHSVPADKVIVRRIVRPE